MDRAFFATASRAGHACGSDPRFFYETHERRLDSDSCGQYIKKKNRAHNWDAARLCWFVWNLHNACGIALLRKRFTAEHGICWPVSAEAVLGPPSKRPLSFVARGCSVSHGETVFSNVHDHFAGVNDVLAGAASCAAGREHFVPLAKFWSKVLSGHDLSSRF